ncbi:MAG: HAMP domain-containing sensor histidine kinase [Sporichthyaceae bacterium]
MLGAVVVGVAFAVLFGAAATWRLHQIEDRALRAALLTRLDLVRDEIRPDGSLRPDRGSPKTELVQVLGPDGKVRAASPALSGLPPLVKLSAVIANGSAEAQVEERSLQNPDTDLAAIGVPLRLPAAGSSPAGNGALVVAVDAEGFSAVTTDLPRLLLAGLISVVAAIALLAWFLAGRALRSVTGLTEEAERVSVGAMHDGLPVPVGDAELARLVTALNRMLWRLSDAHARELAFAADAGHRLRTPVATLRAEAELAIREDDSREQVAALRRIMQDADQLTLIVDRMLARSKKPALSATTVREALEAAESRWSRQADVAGVGLTLTIEPAVPTESCVADLPGTADPIVDNAVRHTPQGGWVVVAVRTDAAQSSIVLDVSNSGPGIDAEMVPKIFDAWVSSRDASVAGGLGLWVARESARAVGGEVTLLDPSPGDTSFRAILPVTNNPS